MNIRSRLHCPFFPLPVSRLGARIFGPTAGRIRILLHALVWIAALLVCAAAAPQTFRNNIFERIGIEAGLSNNTVTSIFQDSRGFLWFGTEEGLNRYDGYVFTVYRKDLQDSTSIGSNRILSINEDRSGLLWIGTADAGLDCFVPSTGKFRHFRNREGDKSSLSHNKVDVIVEDRTGSIWVGTPNGINRLDKKKGTFTRYAPDPRNPGSLPEPEAGSLCRDSEGMLWVGTDSGVSRYDPSADSFIRYPFGKTHLYHSSSIVEGKDGCLWISSWGNGLWKFDRRSGKFAAYHHEPENPSSLRCDYVGHLCIGRNGDLWIGTNEGLDLLRHGSDEFIHFTSDPLDKKSISANGIWGLFTDRTGILWVGTSQGGVNKLVMPRTAFIRYSHDARNPKSLDSDRVTTFLESSDGGIWVGTEHGLNRFDRATSEFTVIHHDARNPRSISSDYVNVLREDSRGIIWVGTSGGGFCLFDPKAKTFRSFRATADSTGLPSDWVHAFCPDSDGKVWIGTFSDLVRFDPETERFTRLPGFFPEDGGQASGRVVNSLVKDRDGNLWVGTYWGLFRHDPARGTVTAFSSSPSDPRTLSDNHVLCLYPDRRGRLWVGTTLGLNRFDRATGKFTRFTRCEGLSNEFINGIGEDGRGNLWISSNGAISKLDTETGRITNFDANDGIPFSVFWERAFLQARDGSFFVGGAEGFFCFHPDSLKSVGVGPKMAITSFRVFNREADTGGAPVSEIKRMVLSHRDTFFSFEFAALDFSAPARNRYLYRLEGFDRDWVHAGNRRYASYTNLDPGKYVFRVKGANKDGVWSEREASMEIVVLPPFWGTWWFRTLATLLLAGIAVGMHLVHIRVIRRQKRKLEELVSLRTRELTEKQTLLLDNQERLARSEELYRGLVETSPDAILVMNMDGVIRMANPRASDLLGGGLAVDLRGFRLRDFLAPDERPRCESLLQKLRDTGGLHNISLALDKGEGLSLPVELNALLIPDPEDLRCIGVLRDISERRRAEEERIEKERLRGVIETAGGASHELNQPLQAIMGYTDILLMGNGDTSKKQEYLEKVRQEARRMGQITHKLTNITQFWTKEYVGDTRIIDLDRSSGNHRSPDEGDGSSRPPAAGEDFPPQQIIGPGV